MRFELELTLRQAVCQAPTLFCVYHLGKTISRPADDNEQNLQVLPRKFEQILSGSSHTEFSCIPWPTRPGEAPKKGPSRRQSCAFVTQLRIDTVVAMAVPGSGKEESAYVATSITPTLTPALVALCRARPADPVEWLGRYLMEHKPAAPVNPVPAVEESQVAADGAAAQPISTLIDPETGEPYVLEEGEEIKHCMRCSRVYVTLSGKTLCMTCRKQVQEQAGITLEEDEELRGCERCHKAFITTSGKKLCVSCRDQLGYDVDEEAGEELRGCERCQKAFITTSGKTLCLACRGS